MAQTIIKPFRARTIRITRLDGCCTAPASGTPCAMAVFDGFVTVSLSAETEPGDEFFSKKASGDICVNEKSPDILKRLNVSLELCEIPPDVIEMLTSWPTASDAASGHVGNDIVAGINNSQIAIEVWTGIAGQQCDPELGERFGYLLLPCVNGVQLSGDAAFGNAPTNITLAGFTSSSHAWVRPGSDDEVGPYDVQADALGDPGPLITPLDPLALARLMSTTVSPPALTDGCVPMPPSS